MLELFVFNYHHWESLVNEKNITISDFNITGGLEYKSKNLFIAQGSENCDIEIEGINGDIKNVYFDIDFINIKKPRIIEYIVFLGDEGNNEYYYGGSQSFITNNKESNYLRIHTYGQLNSLRIRFNLNPGEMIQINSIQLNVESPMIFSVVRILVMYFMIFLYLIFRSVSPLYKINISKILKKTMTVLLIIIEIAFAGIVSFSNPSFIVTEEPTSKEYQKLAISWSEGNLSLSDKPSEELSNLENPYDYSERRSESVDYLWDYSYYNNQYHVYFGAGPVLIYYLPYYLLTGTDLLNCIALFVSAIIFIILVHLLIDKIQKRYFENVPYIMVLLLTATVIFGSGIVYLAKKSVIYNIPILTGLAFTSLGLYFWIASKKKGDCNLDNKKLFCGSLSMAFVLLCRPQLVLGSFIAIPLFWNEIRNFKSNKLIRKSMFISLIPFAILGSLVCYYNFVRFDSIFEFGVNYNLTVNDVSRRVFEFDRYSDGIYKYFLEFPRIINKFPFLSSTNLETNYIGMTVYEPTFGGLFVSNAILFSGLLIFKIKRYFKNLEIYNIGVMSIVIGFVICILDIQLSGIIQRYFYDFSFFFFIAMVIALFAFIDKHSNRKWLGKICYVIFVFAAMSIIYNIALFVVNDHRGIMTENVDMYYSIYRLFKF